MLPHLLHHYMPDTLSLPTAVMFYERRLISAAILSGAAATLDDAVAEAVVARVESIADVRALLRQLQRESLAKKPAAIVRGPFLAEMLLDAAMLQVRRGIFFITEHAHETAVCIVRLFDPRALRVMCCYRRVPKFWTYGSVCCACAQRPGLPRQAFSRTLRSQKP